ncbi:MAG: MATE family efflux transporter [Lachnospiraceae bacterium]|nr:MATE family efflux transporter [Lachnospiraceae bacterium]
MVSFYRRKNRFYNVDAVDWDHLLFTDQDLKKLLWPLIAEQLLNSLMGMMDTMMVSRVGSAAISAVSLVDAINTLFIQIFAAMATGGTILCSQYLGAGDRKQSNSAAQQIALSSLVITAACAVFSIAFRRPLLRVTFGSVEPLVMQDSLDYFLLTAASYPFIGMFQVGSAFYRAGGNSRFPMTISVISNILNIIGNAIFIFGMNMGVTGAALSTLLSRIYAMIVVFAYLRMPRQEIVLRDYFRIRPDWSMIGRVLSVGIPSGVENGMFQFGKLAIQSSVSTLGTTAIAAQAMAAILEGLNGIAGIGIGIGLMTVVGQTIGAGRREEAKYYIVRLSVIGYAAVGLSCLVLYFCVRPITFLAGMEPEAASMCIFMMGWISAVKPIVWVLAFIPGYGLRAAGDVRYSMVMGSIVMWGCRVVLTTVLIRVFGAGPIAVWIGMFSDWTLRGIFYTQRYFSGKWLRHALIN